MAQNNILIIGKKSFVGTCLYNYLKKKIRVKLINYLDFETKEIFKINEYSHIINCSISKHYINKKYNYLKDYDLKIASKIRKTNIKLIFLSSRKVYKPKVNIKESSKLEPLCHYSRNKLKTEIKLKNIMKQQNILIFRISNLVGLPITKNKNKVHYTFIDFFFDSVKKGIIYDNGKSFKDFVSVDKFSEVVYLCIKKKLNGVYNLSIGKKIYLNNLVKWLNYYNKKKVVFLKPNKNFNNDNFTLNSSKLMRHIKIKNRIVDLKKYCKAISRMYFINK